MGEPSEHGSDAGQTDEGDCDSVEVFVFLGEEALPGAVFAGICALINGLSRPPAEALSA